MKLPRVKQSTNTTPSKKLYFTYSQLQFFTIQPWLSPIKSFLGILLNHVYFFWVQYFILEFSKTFVKLLIWGANHLLTSQVLICDFNWMNERPRKMRIIIMSTRDNMATCRIFCGLCTQSFMSNVFILLECIISLINLHSHTQFYMGGQYLRKCN